MFTKLILGLLPAKYRALVTLGLTLTANLDTDAERDEVVSALTSAIADGKMSPPEWSRIGKLLFWSKK